MTQRRVDRETRKHERGAVGVLVAIVLPVMIVLASFVVDFGNAWEHQRHLQLQADAAALAGAHEFVPGSCTDANVVGRAFEYSNIPQAYVNSNTNWTSRVTAYSDPNQPYNAQVGSTAPSNLFEAINSRKYLPASNPKTTDTTSFSGSPCQDNVLDVKMTESDLPWYFKASGVWPFINAHARVSWEEAGGAGPLPVAVDENSPQAVEAYFVDESGNQVGNGFPLTYHGPAGGSGPYASDDIWSNGSATVPITVPGISLILALSGNPNAFATSPTLATACSESLVICWDKTGSGDHLVHIQGYSGTATVRQVQLPASASTCSSAVGTDGYFSNGSSGTCSVGVRAMLSFGSTPSPAGSNVYARVSGSNTCARLAYDNTVGDASYGYWTGSVSIAAGSGANPIDIVVASSCGKKTSATLADAQSAFAANSSNAGTIDGVILGDPAGTGEAANSYSMCGTCQATFSITADIGGSLQDLVASSSNPNPPIFALNFGSGNTASQTGTIACPPGSNSGAQLTASLISGCPGTYVPNNTVWGNDSSCVYTNPGPGGTPSPPADCVATKNGVTNGTIDPGMYCRFVGGSQCATAANPTGAPPVGQWVCPAAWNHSVSNPPDNVQPNDDRFVTLFITPYDSFTGSGSQNVPVLAFAYFYVMGWSANGPNADPCTSDQNSRPASGGRIWGYFFSYTKLGGSDTHVPCKDSPLGACQIVLTQ